MRFYGFVYGFLYFYELLFVALSPFCFVLFCFLFLSLYLGCAGLVWICLSGFVFIGKAGTWELQCCWIFFFFGSYIGDLENWVGLFVLRNCWIFYVFRVQCWIKWKCKLSAWWNDFVSYAWFIEWDDFDIFLYLQWLLSSQKYFVCLSWVAIEQVPEWKQAIQQVPAWRGKHQWGATVIKNLS